MERSAHTHMQMQALFETTQTLTSKQQRKSAVLHTHTHTHTHVRAPKLTVRGFGEIWRTSAHAAPAIREMQMRIVAVKCTQKRCGAAGHSAG